MSANFTIGSQAGVLYLGSITIDLSSSDISGIYPTLDVSVNELPNAHALLLGNEDLDLSGIFWFKTDSIDVSNNDIGTSDLQFAYNKIKFDKRISEAINALVGAGGLASDLKVLNLSEADASGGVIKNSVGPDSDIDASSAGTTTFGDLSFTGATGGGGAFYHCLPSKSGDQTLKKDIARFIAFKLTGGYSGTDIFTNELELVDAISTELDSSDADGQGLFHHIENHLTYADDVVYDDDKSSTVAPIWDASSSAPTSGINGSSDPSNNFTEVFINYLKDRNGDEDGTESNIPANAAGASGGWQGSGPQDGDIGRFLIKQAKYAYGKVGLWSKATYGINGDASGQTDVSSGWVPLTMNRPVTVVIKILIKNIAGKSHGNQDPSLTGAEDVGSRNEGGANRVGSRSYLIALKDVTTANLTDLT